MGHAGPLAQLDWKDISLEFAGSRSLPLAPCLLHWKDLLTTERAGSLGRPTMTDSPVWDRIWTFCKSNTGAATAPWATCSSMDKIDNTHTQRAVPYWMFLNPQAPRSPLLALLCPGSRQPKFFLALVGSHQVSLALAILLCPAPFFRAPEGSYPP